MLLDHNLIKGGDVNNAIVIVDKPVDDKENGAAENYIQERQDWSKERRLPE